MSAYACKVIAANIKRMNLVSFMQKRELLTIIGLKGVRCVTKVSQGTFKEVSRGIAKPAVYTVKEAGMSGITFVGTKFSIKFTNRNMRISSVIIPDTFQFFKRMKSRMDS